MADRTSLQLIGLVMAGLTFGVTLIAGTLVYRSVNEAQAGKPDAYVAYPSPDYRPFRLNSAT